MMRTMRAKVLVDLVGLSLVGSACTNGAGSDPPVQDPRAGARLDALGERWMTTVATITYRTKRRDPGEATSPHQCLIRFVGDTVDRRTGVMLCWGTGEMRLAWERSDRWRTRSLPMGVPRRCSGPTSSSAAGPKERRRGASRSRSGFLLSLFDGIQDGRVRSAEATDVSPGVLASDLVTPTT
jgi:hypothetical protein